MHFFLYSLLILSAWTLSWMERSSWAKEESKPTKAASEGHTDAEKKSDATAALNDFERAQHLFEKGYENLALVSLKDFVRKYPTHPKVARARLWAAKLLQRKGELSASENEYRKIFQVKGAESLDEILIEGTLGIGQVLFLQNKLNEAQIEFEALLRKFPKSKEATEARKHLGDIHAKQSS